MACLFLTEDEVTQLLDMPSTLAVVEEAFRQLAAGKAHNVPRVRAKGDGIVLHSMSGAADYLGIVGWKQYTTTRQGARFHAAIYDSISGQMLALLEANRLGQMRTGAVTGVAAKYLALPRANVAGIIGSGWQAQSQLAALAAACPLKRAVVYSRNDKHRIHFAEIMSKELNIDVTPVEGAEAAVHGMPLVVTATTSSTPVIRGDDLSPGTLVCAVGSNWLHKAEIDPAALQRAAAVICDSIECCQLEAGDLVQAAATTAFDWSRAVDLADVVAGKAAVRNSPDDILVFKSVGMAIEDVAIAHHVLHKAREAGLGRELPL
jgi:ornithine cyclodeaminase/alanine dehydrogenase-like protein (mu-crystallin family)